jgi:H+-transporting ATPase
MPDSRLTVAVLASSHNIRALDPIDKVTVVTLKVRDRWCQRS